MKDGRATETLIERVAGVSAGSQDLRGNQGFFEQFFNLAIERQRRPFHCVYSSFNSKKSPVLSKTASLPKDSLGSI